MARPPNLGTWFKRKLGIIQGNPEKPPLVGVCEDCKIFKLFLQELDRIYKIDHEFEKKQLEGYDTDLTPTLPSAIPGATPIHQLYNQMLGMIQPMAGEENTPKKGGKKR